MMMYVAVILLCSVLATNANASSKDNVELNFAEKDERSPSTMEDVDNVPVEVADYGDDGDEKDLLVDQLEDIKMADELLRDIETGKVRDIKDPIMISTLLGGAKAAMAVAPHVQKVMPHVHRWGSRLGWGRRRRRGRW